jgi:DNA-binding response OmpR family regulator
VDDEPIVVRSVTSTLGHAGYTAIVAENGATGLEAFLSQPDDFALVLTDVRMPVMNGIAMAEEIRKARPDIPIVMMTGYSEVMEKVHSARFAVLRKPFLAQDLLLAIGAHVSPRSAGA